MKNYSSKLSRLGLLWSELYQPVPTVYTSQCVGSPEQDDTSPFLLQLPFTDTDHVCLTMLNISEFHCSEGGII